VLDSGKKALKHAPHGRVQIVDIFLDRGLQIFAAQICGRDNAERGFQFGRYIFFKWPSVNRTYQNGTKVRPIANTGTKKMLPMTIAIPVPMATKAGTVHRPTETVAPFQ